MTVAAMNSAIAAFTAFWNQVGWGTPPHVHPRDAPYLQSDEVELRLLPIPVNGDLAQAEAVVLTLNPGLDNDDYQWEERLDFRESLLRNLRQKHPQNGWPLNYLDPAFSQHPGAGYWSMSRGTRTSGKDLQKFNSVVQAIAARDSVSETAARQHVAKKVTILQLCPYHSKSKPRAQLLSNLPSSTAARGLVQSLILGGDKLVIATRSVAEWGFQQAVTSDRLVVYPSALGASASLTLNSAGGAALVRVLSRAVSK